MNEITENAFLDELEKIADSGKGVFKTLLKRTKPSALEGVLGKGTVPETLRTGWLSSLSEKVRPVASEALRGEHRLLSTPSLLQLKEKLGWGGGAVNFLKGGVGALKGLGSAAGRSGLMGELKELPGQLSRAWKSGGIGQVGNVLRYSAPVQGAALAGGGLWAANKARQWLRGPQQPQQQGG